MDSVPAIGGIGEEDAAGFLIFDPTKNYKNK